MTLGVLSASAVGVGIAVATAGTAAPLVAAAANTAATAATGAAVASGTVSAGTAAAAVTATGAAAGAAGAAAGGAGAAATVGSVVTGGALAGGVADTAVKGGLAGAAVAGPWGAFFFCFQEDVEVVKEDGTAVKVGELKVGDKILSKLDLGCQSTANTFALVTNATKVVGGEFPAHKITFNNGKHITITSPHLMITKSDKEMKMVAAKDLKLLDEMAFDDGSYSKIEKIEDVVLPVKVNIETSTGLLFANGLLTSGMCEKTPDLENNSAGDILGEYTASHFGKDMLESGVLGNALDAANIVAETSRIEGWATGGAGGLPIVV